ncbi:MFS general substrate transporter [Polyporus arcularius HHB13444]|uniref:MFS general substrate transporter n=1 Tax=Polyporus arcularius HHB13444 TaxID=1314778 RepID=A0A5C3PP16_9APHY|nr:MFS general substrate transporter [Polyporus arcularius HHB13444]
MASSQTPSLYNEPDAIELAPIGLKYDSATSSAIQSLAASSHHNGVSLTSAGAGDVEGAPSFPIDSSRGDEDANPAISAAQKAVQRRKRMINLATLCFDVFLNGWNDATAGPLLPRIQAYYGIGFAIVSLIFVSSAVGFITGAFLNVYLTDRYGFGKVIVLGSTLQCIAYALVAPAGPFPLMCVAYALVGFGLSLQNAHYNAFVASSKDYASTKIGILLASYGLGAFVAPLVSTQFAQQKHWSYYFLISSVMYALNSALLWIVFRGKRQDEIKAEADDLSPQQEVVQSNKYKQIFRIREVHILSLFALLYVGTEVTIGGWTVSYVQETRNGSSDAGYISSGFFAGMTLGRIFLMWLNDKIGERRALFIYALLAIVLEVTVWVVPSLIENGVAVAFIGLLLGPMYPILVHHSTHILPRWLLTGCMGYISSIGQTGSAVLPFLTGLLASKFGIASLQPFIVSMMSVMMVVWALVPRVRHVPT